jgi:hypothetical protein
MDYNENEYTFKNIVKARTNRVVCKIEVVKDNMGDILTDSGSAAKTIAEKTFYASMIGIGGLLSVGGFISGDPKKMAIGGVGGVVSILIGASCLKNSFEYISAIEELSYVKDDIEQMIDEFKDVNLSYPIPKKEGRSL